MTFAAKLMHQKICFFQCFIFDADVLNFGKVERNTLALVLWQSCHTKLVLTRGCRLMAGLIARIWTFAPAFLVFVGAAVAAGGSLWGAFRQSSFNSELRAKNDEISKLQMDNIQTLKGSDICYFVVIPEPDESGKLPLLAINPSNLPVYDVSVSIRSHVDYPIDTPEHEKEFLHYATNLTVFSVGNISGGATKLSYASLEPGYYQIDIRTRYQRYIEMIRFGSFNGSIGQSWLVTNFTGKIIEKSTSPDGYKAIY